MPRPRHASAHGPSTCSSVSPISTSLSWAIPIVRPRRTWAADGSTSTPVPGSTTTATPSSPNRPSSSDGSVQRNHLRPLQSLPDETRADLKEARLVVAYDESVRGVGSLGCREPASLQHVLHDRRRLLPAVDQTD